MVLGFMDGTTEESSHPDGDSSLAYCGRDSDLLYSDTLAQEMQRRKRQEKALDEVLTELVDEPVQSLTELRDNIRKDFRKYGTLSVKSRGLSLCRNAFTKAEGAEMGKSAEKS